MVSSGQGIAPCGVDTTPDQVAMEADEVLLQRLDEVQIQQAGVVGGSLSPRSGQVQLQSTSSVLDIFNLDPIIHKVQSDK